MNVKIRNLDISPHKITSVNIIIFIYITRALGAPTRISSFQRMSEERLAQKGSESAVD